MKKKKSLNLFLKSCLKLNKKTIKNFIFLFLLGVLSSFSLPPYNFFFINFITFSLLFVFLFKNKNVIKNKFLFFIYGWLFGYGYFLSNLYWISISLTFDENFNFLMPLAVIFIPAFLAIFYGLVTFFFLFLRTQRILTSILFFSLLFGIVEFIRGYIFTGFPWNLIIYSLSEMLTFISIISIIGTYSLNLIIITFFTLPAVFILRNLKKNYFVISFLILSPIFFLVYGIYYKANFSKLDLEKNETIIRIISSNISLDRFYKSDQTEKVIIELIDISRPDKDKKILFLWPEGIIPNISQSELYLYKEFFDKNFSENHIIGLGINNIEKKDGRYKYYNSFSLFDNELNLLDSYNKINLVPFGEFLPFEKILSKIGLKTITNNYQSYSKGNLRKIMKISNDMVDLKFLPLICYEIIYSGSISKKNNFDFIVNISEDGWFGESIGPKQHFVHSIFRSIESGKYILRSANNGITAIINPLGIAEKKVNLTESGYIDFEYRKNSKPTVFSMLGNKIFGLFILLYIFLIISFNREKNE